MLAASTRIVTVWDDVVVDDKDVILLHVDSALKRQNGSCWVSSCCGDVGGSVFSFAAGFQTTKICALWHSTNNQNSLVSKLPLSCEFSPKSGNLPVFSCRTVTVTQFSYDQILSSRWIFPRHFRLLSCRALSPAGMFRPLTQPHDSNIALACCCSLKAIERGLYVQ